LLAWNQRREAVRAERKARAGLSRTIKLRLYPSAEQSDQIKRTIGTIRYVWNQIWLPMVREIECARSDHAKANGGTPAAWRDAYRLFPDPTETAYNQARISAGKDGSGREWIAEALQTPLSRAARNFAAAVKASRGRTQIGGKRKLKAGKVRPRRRCDDPREGLEWQLQGDAPLGGRELSRVVDVHQRVVNVPGIGKGPYKDKGRQLRAYLVTGAEACEMTLKRDGRHYYACIAVRGLQPAEAHVNAGSSIGIDMGVDNPVATSDGKLVTHHQRHDIKAHLARLEHKKLRIKRACGRKLRAAAKKAGALTETGAFRKGVSIPTSNRTQRLNDRLNKIERQIVGYRADWQRNAALEMARHSEIIVVEALSVKNMTRSAAGTIEKPGRNVRAKAALNRSILARGFGSMRARLVTKAQELGGQVIEVDPAYTSQECPRCGHTDRDNRKTQARFECGSCAFTQHADVVGAINVLRRGLSAGAPPVAGRGGCATDSVPSVPMADEPSNKSSCEPEASFDAEGSHDAKPYQAYSGIALNLHTSRQHQQGPPGTERPGSRTNDESEL
jgi:putative transposase